MQSKLVDNQRVRKSAQPRKKTLYLLLTSVALIGIAYLILGRQSGMPEAPIDVATLSPPLEHVDFPIQQVPYPPDWPTELRYPEQFAVVEISSGSLPDSASIGWGTKLRYAGDPKTAASILLSFFADHSWQIVEHTDLDTGGVLLVIKRDNGGSGIVIIDSDVGDPNNTIIVATIFP